MVPLTMERRRIALVAVICHLLFAGETSRVASPEHERTSPVVSSAAPREPILCEPSTAARMDLQRTVTRSFWRHAVVVSTFAFDASIQARPLANAIATARGEDGPQSSLFGRAPPLSFLS